jgi:copper(I)-binding protein
VKTPRILFLIALAAIALFAAAACGGDDDDDGGATGTASPTPVASVGDLEIVGPFSRGTLDRGAVFFTVVNNGEEDDRLVGASIDIAGTTEIHETVMQDGQAQMRPIDGLDIPAGKETVLKPGGYHVMLLDLPEPLEVGQTFPVELTFEKAGKVEFTVEVESYSDEDPMEGGMNGGATQSPGM